MTTRHSAGIFLAPGRFVVPEFFILVHNLTGEKDGPFTLHARHLAPATRGIL
jgi:hypothetical protein